MAGRTTDTACFIEEVPHQGRVPGGEAEHSTIEGHLFVLEDNHAAKTIYYEWGSAARKTNGDPFLALQTMLGEERDLFIWKTKSLEDYKM